ncbi:hypothetical protein ZHAS_00019257 [Anopheles sinensis]|uniref:Uncharacterized protein n=1 Tax=Anopheles sinensis TaxID=74873 RepID=A0A084WL15_ANOSI|nr:hypothetical protein ZHAS_00019257 [Anopheles sinensis]
MYPKGHAVTNDDGTTEHKFPPRPRHTSTRGEWRVKTVKPSAETKVQQRPITMIPALPSRSHRVLLGAMVILAVAMRQATASASLCK